MKNQQEYMLKQQQLMNEQLETSQRNTHLLLDKAIALVGTSDPLAFQAVQAMSPEAEYDGQAPPGQQAFEPGQARDHETERHAGDEAPEQDRPGGQRTQEMPHPGSLA